VLCVTSQRRHKREKEKKNNMAYYCASSSSSSSSSYDEQQIMRRQQKERNEGEEICSNGSNNFSTKNRRRCCGIDIDIDIDDTSITKTPLLMMLILFLLLLVTTSIATVDPIVKIMRYHQHPQQQQQQQQQQDRDGDRFFFREGKSRMTVLPATSSSTTTTTTTATSSSSLSTREDDDNYINIMWQRNLVEENQNQEQEEITVDVDIDTDTKNETTTPTIAPTTIMIQKSLFLSVSAIVLGIISTAFAIGLWIFVCCHRNNPIVSIGQPPFLYLICFGSLLMSSSLFFEGGIIDYFGQVPQYTLNNICIIKLWLQDVGIIIVYMSLFCKLWRAEQVTQFRRGNTVHVHHVIGPLFVILIIQIGLLIGHTIVTPPYWTDVPMRPHDFDDPLRMETCYQFNFDDPINVIFNASSLILLVVCEIITMWMACKTRNLREDISDSWRVFQTMCFQFFVTIPYALLIHGVIPARDLYYLIEIGYPFLLAMSSTGFIIIPKMYIVWYKNKYGQLPDYVQSSVGIGRVVVNISGRPSGTYITTDNCNATRNSNNITERITASKSTITTTDIPPSPPRTSTISFLDENQSPKSNNSESSLPNPIQEEENEEQP
jgi:hypothetical protein